VGPAPSHQENFAIAVVEALAVNTPVLISDKVQIWREVVRSGAGLADSDTAVGTERLLQRWMALDNLRRTEFRHRAGECYRSCFNAELAGETVLREILARVRSSKAETSAALGKLCANG
jgi:glycosyltransferase involved in cell wall biosynthesis